MRMRALGIFPAIIDGVIHGDSNFTQAPNTTIEISSNVTLIVNCLVSGINNSVLCVNNLVLRVAFKGKLGIRWSYRPSFVNLLTIDFFDIYILAA